MASHRARRPGGSEARRHQRTALDRPASDDGGRSQIKLVGDGGASKISESSAAPVWASHERQASECVRAFRAPGWWLSRAGSGRMPSSQDRLPQERHDREAPMLAEGWVVLEAALRAGP